MVNNLTQKAAINLSETCKKVVVFEYANALKADSVLQKKIESFSNIDIRLNSQTLRIVTQKDKIAGIEIKNIKNGKSMEYKQIIIAMGEDAKASLSAFDNRRKGLI